MIKKSATSNNYTIIQHDSGSIEVYEEFNNTKGALREIAEEIEFDFDPDWNTRTFGAKLIQFINEDNKAQMAQSGEYLVIRHENQSIEVRRIFSNTKGALREIAEEIDFDFDPDWNTRTFGSKLIDELN